MLEIGSGRREEKSRREEEDRRKIAALHANEGEEEEGGGRRAATCQLDGIQFRATKQTTTIRWDHGRQQAGEAGKHQRHTVRQWSSRHYQEGNLNQKLWMKSDYPMESN